MNSIENHTISGDCGNNALFAKPNRIFVVYAVKHKRHNKNLKFIVMGSNPPEVDGFFFSGRKNPERNSSGRDFKSGVPSR